MAHLFSRFRIRALGVAARLLPAPTPFMLTGPGSSLELARLIADCGARSVLVVTDKVLVELGVVAPVLTALQEAGLAVTVFSEVEPDPTIAIVMAGIEQLRASGATAVLAVGGGSPIDAAKAMVACHASGRRPQDLDGYFKVRAAVLPFFAVPTTAGSGSEVTVASVVSDPGAGRKFAIVDNKLVPAAIALDPNLMVGLPQHVTAATGMDALTHAIESDLFDTRHTGDASPVRGRGACDLSRSAPGLRGWSRHRRPAEPCRRVMPRWPRLYQGERRLRPRDRPPTRPALPSPARAPERDLAPVRARLLRRRRRLADGGARARLWARARWREPPGRGPPVPGAESHRRDPAAERVRRHPANNRADRRRRHPRDRAACAGGGARDLPGAGVHVGRRLHDHRAARGWPSRGRGDGSSLTRGRSKSQ